IVRNRVDTFGTSFGTSSHVGISVLGELKRQLKHGDHGEHGVSAEACASPCTPWSPCLNQFYLSSGSCTGLPVSAERSAAKISSCVFIASSRSGLIGFPSRMPAAEVSICGV